MRTCQADGQPSGMDGLCAPTPDNGRPETLVRVGRKEFRIPCQADGWDVAPELRRDAIAELWRIIRSRRIKAEIKIRAIETLVRIDSQALAETRQEEWREAQQASHSRSNVRILAELARQRSLPANPPRPGKGERKP